MFKIPTANKDSEHKDFYKDESDRMQKLIKSTEKHYTSDNRTEE